MKKDSGSVPYILLPPDNSIPEESKVVTKKITTGYEIPEIPSFVQSPTQHPTILYAVTPLLPTSFPATIHSPKPIPIPATKQPSEKSIHINIVMPTAPKAIPPTPATPLANTEHQSDNHTTIDLNLNIGEDGTVQEKQPIILQVNPTAPTPRVVVPPAQQVLAALASNLQLPVGQSNGLMNSNLQYPSRTVTSPQGNVAAGMPWPIVSFPQVGMPTLRGLINGGINTNFPVSGINTNFPVSGINTNFPVSGVNNNLQLPGISNNFPGLGNNPITGINNNVPLFGTNNNLPNNGIGTNFPYTGINNNFPGINNIPGNFQPQSGINNNIQGYPSNNPQLLQQISSTISESIKSSMALSQPEIIASALQRLAVQTQNANQPEQLLSNALTQALTGAVGQNGDISQEQKLVNSLATALNMLNNRGTGAGILGVPNAPATNPSMMPSSQTPLKVEVVNLPQQAYQPNQPNQLSLANGQGTVQPFPSNQFNDNGFGKIAVNTLGKAMATALVNTAKKMVSGVQRDKILRSKDLQNLSANLTRYFKESWVFKRLRSLKRGILGHRPHSRQFLRNQRKFLRNQRRRCCCCCN